VIDDLLDLDWLPDLDQLAGVMDNLPPQVDLQPDPDAVPPAMDDLPAALSDALGALPEEDDDFLGMDHAAVGAELLRAAVEGLSVRNPFAPV